MKINSGLINMKSIKEKMRLGKLKAIANLDLEF